jgi:hypothetical protein
MCAVMLLAYTNIITIVTMWRCLWHAAAATQIVDLDSFALAVECPIPAVNATDKELADAERLAKNGPLAAVASDGSGLSSRPGAPNTLWLDFAGSTITGTGIVQQRIVCCSTPT